MDGVSPSYELSNAVAGPSSIPQDAPIVFLPPSVAYSQPQGFLASTQDLLARLRLHAAYDKHVRIPPETSAIPSPPIAQTNLQFPPNTDEKKKKNSYRHLIKSLPGKHSMKKDDYLTTMMQVPPKQRIPIVEFDARTQQEAFTVTAEGLKGWNAGALILESTQAREDRKKRKELKKLARAQVQGLTPGSMPGTPGALQQPQSVPPHSTIPSAQQPPGISLPTQAKPRVAPVTIPPPVSAPSGTTASAVPASAPPQRTSTPVPSRSQKRELEDGVVEPPTPTSLCSNPPVGVVGARAGAGNVRPRPIKKQRMSQQELMLFHQDIQGQSRGVLIQQPTPQGS